MFILKEKFNTFQTFSNNALATVFPYEIFVFFKISAIYVKQGIQIMDIGYSDCDF